MKDNSTLIVHATTWTQKTQLSFFAGRCKKAMAPMTELKKVARQRPGLVFQAGEYFYVRQSSTKA